MVDYRPVRFAWTTNQDASSGETVILRRYPAGSPLTGGTGLRSRGAYAEASIQVFEDARSDRRTPDQSGSRNDGTRTLYTTSVVYPTDGPLQRPADVIIFAGGERARQVWQVVAVDDWHALRPDKAAAWATTAGYAITVRYAGALRGEPPFDD